MHGDCVFFINFVSYLQVTFEMCSKYVDEWILVDEEEISHATFKFLDYHHKVCPYSTFLFIRKRNANNCPDMWFSSRMNGNILNILFVFIWTVKLPKLI